MGLLLASASSQYVNLGTSLPGLLRNVTGFTVSLWVKQTGEGAYNYVSIGIGPPPGTTNASRLSFDSTGSGWIRILARSSDGGGTNTLETSGSVLTDGVWSHIAATVKIATSNGEIRIYVDGAEVRSDTAVSFAASATSDTDPKCGCIGAEDDGSGGFVNAALADVKIWNRVLTAGEIEAEYVTRGGVPNKIGLQAQWPLNELATGSTASGASSVKDLCGLYPATPTNSPTYQAVDFLRTGALRRTG